MLTQGLSAPVTEAVQRTVGFVAGWESLPRAVNMDMSSGVQCVASQCRSQKRYLHDSVC